MAEILFGSFRCCTNGLPSFSMKGGKISTTLGYMVNMLAQGGPNPAKTIVSMILVKIIKAFSACANGKRYFEGCNLLLQLRAIEPFYKRDNLVTS